MKNLLYNCNCNVDIDMNMDIDNSNSKQFLLQVKAQNVIAYLISHCGDEKNVKYHYINLPFSLRNLIIKIIKSGILCGIIKEEHYLDIICDILYKDSWLSEDKMKIVIMCISNILSNIVSNELD